MVSAVSVSYANLSSYFPSSTQSTTGNQGFQLATNTKASQSLTAANNAATFRQLSNQEYFNNRFQTVQTWVGDQYSLETSLNEHKLKAALAGYTNAGANPIGVYTFDINPDGIIQTSGPLQGQSLEDTSDKAFSNLEISQALQATDSNRDGLISNQEITNRMQELGFIVRSKSNPSQATAQIQEQQVLHSITSQLAFVNPDQFIQYQNTSNGGLALKVFNADAPPPLSITSTSSPINNSKVYSNADLRALLPILQKADIDNDGKLTLKELKNYQQLLEKQRDSISKMASDKLVMDALSSQQVAMARDKLLGKIDGQLKQIDDLFQTDRQGTSNFTKLATALGNNEALNLDNMVSTIHAQAGISIPIS